METRYFLGLDISKKKIDTALTMDGINVYEMQLENTPTAIKDFLYDLKEKFAFSFHQLIICLEHTGIYCQPLLEQAAKNKINVCLEPALQIKQSQGMTRGKTDRVDAKRIACMLIKTDRSLNFGSLNER